MTDDFTLPAGMENFPKDRKAALLSLDKNRIRAYAIQYDNKPLLRLLEQDNDELFWEAVHTERARSAEWTKKHLEEEDVEFSQNWLTQHAALG